MRAVQYSPASGPAATTVAAAEVARFDALAEAWWDPHGPMRVLHQMNPARIGWIAERIGPPPLRILDVGCGAGLAAEALARRGHDVLGIDAAGAAIAAAQRHAALSTTAPRPAYRVAAAEDLAAEGARFPVVTALEVIEHTPDPAAFLRVLAAVTEPGGAIVISTLNRTTRSLLFAKIGAEYLLRLLPVGTHDWRRFITPAELGAHARAAGLRLEDAAGLVPKPLGGWRTGRDMAVNYIALLRAPG